MPRLITVHGTSAGADSDVGELWWQKDNPFLTRLGMVLDLSQVDVSQFHWGIGPNSEKRRREAGKELYTELRELDAKGVDYYLIGHSHGGSVIYNALLYSTLKRKPLRRLQAWCTIGTPFIDIAPKRFLFARLNAPGLAIYALGLTLVIVAIALVAGYVAGSPLTRLIDEKLGGAAFGNLFGPMLASTCAIAIATYAILYAYGRLLNRWISDRVKRRTAELYAGSWIGLSHADDEAIAALRGASNFKPEIVPRDFLARPFSMLPVLAIAALLLALIWWLENTLQLPIDRLQKFAAALHSLKPSAMSSSFWQALPGIQTLIVWTVFIAVVLLITTAVVYGFRLIGGLIGRPIAASIDRLVWYSVREQAWGDDLDAEYVRGVSSHPPMFAFRFNPLPPSVAEPIADLANSSAGDTLKKLRTSIGMTNTSARSSDFLTTALTQLNWRELIHTAYFDLDPFVRLVAQVLHRQGLAGLKSDAWTPEERAASHQAYLEMRVRSIVHLGEVESVGNGLTVSKTSSLDLSVATKTLLSLTIVLGGFIVGMLLTCIVVPWHWAALAWLGGAVFTVTLAQLLPVSTRDLESKPRPAPNFEEAKQRFKEWASAPEATIHPRCVPFVLDHGKRVPCSYVLVHGISNCPYSMVDFATKLHALGHNVVVVRMPQNGHLDNGTDALRFLTALELREFADKSLDIAAGLGERVHVVGISAGGVVAGWMAQNRSEIDRVVLLAPAYGLSSFGSGLNNALMRLILLVPNFSIWKDPIKRADADNRPHSYKRQSTRGMGEVMRLGLATLRQAKKSRPAATAITLVTNGADVAIDPTMPEALAKQWEKNAAPVTRYVFPKELGLPHELIDPTEEGANIQISHPKIIELAERRPELPQRAKSGGPNGVESSHIQGNRREAIASDCLDGFDIPTPKPNEL